MTLISLLLESILKILFHLLMHINCVCGGGLFVLGVVRPVSRTPLGELKQSNAPIDRMYKWVCIIITVKHVSIGPSCVWTGFLTVRSVYSGWICVIAPVDMDADCPVYFMVKGLSFMKHRLIILERNYRKYRSCIIYSTYKLVLHRNILPVGSPGW